MTMLMRNLRKSNKDLEEIRKSATQNDTKSQAKQEEIKKNNMLLGLQEVKGEGLLIKLADNNTGILKNGSEALDPSSQIVHYDDLIEVINALNNAGSRSNISKWTENSSNDCNNL